MFFPQFTLFTNNTSTLRVVGKIKRKIVHHIEVLFMK